jgi:nucleotide-binding universal stress UspA family protein
MHRVIIPVDFSDTSFNAARFAAQMLAGKPGVTVILYHRYRDPDERDICISYLESLKLEMQEKGVSSVEYETEMGGDLVDNLDKLSHQRRASLIVMGITGRSDIEQIFIGSNTLQMVEHSICPVLIIPPDASYSEIRNVAFASEFKNVAVTTPVVFIKKVLEMFKPFLHIVNVNPEHYVALTEEYQREKEKLREMFSEYDKEFYFIGMNDFYEAIDNFVRDYKIDLLLTVPRHHKSISTLFKSTHTQKLAYHSHVPLLAVHE